LQKYFRRACLAGAGLGALGGLSFAPLAAASAQVTAPSSVYVSSKGSNANAGTSAAPYKGIQYAIDHVAPGGIVHIAAGTYRQTFLINQPVTIDGAGDTKTIISNYNDSDTTVAGGPTNAGAPYYGTIGIDNLSGTAGTTTVENVKVWNPFFTATEAADLTPTDIANVNDAVAGDKVVVNNVVLGGATQEIPGTTTVENNVYGSIGYYQNDTTATATVENTMASGIFQAFFAEGNTSLSLTKDAVTDATPLGINGTIYPGEGVRGIADAVGTQNLSVTDSTFSGYAGFGIKSEAGYTSGNCNTACVGTENLTASGNTFTLKGRTGAAAIALLADNSTSSLSATLTDNTGTVTSPTVGISESATGSSLSVSETGNTIK